METSVRTGMSLEAFLDLSAQQDFELIDGEMIQKMPPVFGHSRLIRLLLRLLDAYLLSSKRGEVFVETTFIMPDADLNNWVTGSRIPDLMVFLGDRLANYLAMTPDAEARPLALVPDIVIEVTSPNDRFTDVMSKVETYRRDGVRLTWVIDMQSRTAIAIEGESQVQRSISAEGVLEAQDLLPGFSLKLADLFA